MTHEQMTVHQALCELKILNKRIIKAISASKPISTKEHSSKKVDGIDIGEFNEIAKSAHDSAVDLIRRQSAIKSAVNQYNAERRITVCGEEYSVAQAIWLMNYGMREQRDLLTLYTDMLANATRNIERANGDDLNRRAEAAMNAIHGGRDKANNEEYLRGIEDYKASHALELVDPIGIRKVIADLEKKISDFEANVDSAIQVANATTILEIAY